MKNTHKTEKSTFPEYKMRNEINWIFLWNVPRKNNLLLNFNLSKIMQEFNLKISMLFCVELFFESKLSREINQFLFLGGEGSVIKKRIYNLWLKYFLWVSNPIEKFKLLFINKFKINWSFRDSYKNIQLISKKNCNLQKIIRNHFVRSWTIIFWLIPNHKLFFILFFFIQQAKKKIN